MRTLALALLLPLLLATNSAPAMPEDLRESLDGQLDEGELSPLIVATARGDAARVRKLIRGGADIDGSTEPMDYDFGWTPLMIARAKGYTGIVKRLERLRAEEECHLFGTADEDLKLRKEAGGEKQTDFIPAGTAVVVIAAKGKWLDVIEYTPEFRAGGGRHGWTLGKVSPQIDGASIGDHPYGPFTRPARLPLRMLGCHAYAARVIDADDRRGWVPAVHGPGWSG